MDDKNPIREKVGRYKVLDTLGKGGMGKVYKVAMPVTGKIVALKILDPFEVLLEILGPQKVKEIFVAEALTMANLRNLYLTDIWDFDEDEEGWPFFTMEYYCNNLGTMIGEHYEVEKPSRVVEPDKVLHYGRQITQGLACLHHAGIIHRDIKPFNIMITDQDNVKICDFGLSKKRGESFSGPDTMQVGSPYYTAPEQSRNPDFAEERSDIYSVGVLLYRMLTGKLPTKKHHAPSSSNGLFSRKWDDFFEVALHHDQNQRFRSAMAMLDKLTELQNHWNDTKEKVCKIWKPTIQEIDSCVQLRKNPTTIDNINAKSLFGLSDEYRPLEFMENDFINNGDLTITDKLTGLVWQQTGSDYPAPWQEAVQYIETLNSVKCGGRTDWRLPTINELLSLVSGVFHIADYCRKPIFDLSRKWLWSSDQTPENKAWYLSLDMCFVGWQDMSCCYYIRAVAG